MAYGFEFRYHGFIYYDCGSKTKKETKSKLEKIIRTHCKIDNSPIVTMYKVRNGSLNKLERYKIKLK